MVVNRRAPLEIYQNATRETGNWLLLDVAQPGPNPDAIGAWVEIEAGNRSWTRELTIGGGHASGKQALQHFGLGGELKARLRVQWPDGETSDWYQVGVNRILRLTNSNGAVAIEQL